MSDAMLDYLWQTKNFFTEHNFDNMVLLNRQRKDIKNSYYTIFPHSGLLLFCGSQGQGKTTSAVQFLWNIIQDYPKARIVTNVDICFMGIPNEIVRYEDTDSLAKYGNNGLDGVIFLIDEIHLQWNSLESKSISPADMIEFAQSRKQRRLIIGTSQRMTRLAKPMREQLKYVVDCRCLFGCIQRNILIDMEECMESLDGTIEIVNGKPYWFFHDFLLRNEGFNTYQKMVRSGTQKWRK